MNHRDWNYHTTMANRRARERRRDDAFGDAHPVIALSMVITLACILAIIGVLCFARHIF